MSIIAEGNALYLFQFKHYLEYCLCDDTPQAVIFSPAVVLAREALYLR